MRSALPLAALTLATVTTLSGCLPQTPEVTAPPEPTVEPVFASDEEALAAATEAYAAYLAMSDQIAQEGGKDPERIAPYVTEEWLEQELLVFEAMAAANHRQTGAVTVRAMELQAHHTNIDGSAIAGVYYCLGFSSTRLLSDAGVDITPPSRPSEVTVEVQFQASERDSTLKIDRIEPWPTSGIC